MGLGWWSPDGGALDVESLDLQGREQEIATIIAEETEAARAAELDSLPPLTPEELARPPQSMGLLQEPLPPEEARRNAIHAKPWDTYLRHAEAVTRIAERTRLGPIDVIEFAIRECRPHNWEALFWYQQWASEAIQQRVSLSDASRMVAERERALIEERSRRGGEGKASAYGKIEQLVVDEWKKSYRRYDSKRVFAEAMQVVIQERFGKQSSITTITDKYLSPSRHPDLPGK